MTPSVMDLRTNDAINVPHSALSAMNADQSARDGSFTLDVTLRHQEPAANSFAWRSASGGRILLAGGSLPLQHWSGYEHLHSPSQVAPRRPTKRSGGPWRKRHKAGQRGAHAEAPLATHAVGGMRGYLR